MHRLNRFYSVGHLCACSTATTTTAYPKRFFRPNQPVRSLRRVIDSPPPAATPGIDDATTACPKRFFLPNLPVRSRRRVMESPPKNEIRINDSNNTYETKVLPPELSRCVVTLTCESSAGGGVCDVYLVGTVHDTPESCQRVQAVMDFVKPQVVFLELCRTRADILKPQNFEPRSEFCVAYEEAMKYGGKVILGDRPIEITVTRTMAKMPLFNHALYFLPQMVKQRNVNVHEITFSFEDIIRSSFTRITTETFVHERDQYMSAKLLKVARKHNSVVAVVGKAHLPGIQKYWKQPVEMKQLLAKPPDSSISWIKIVASIGVHVAGVTCGLLTCVWWPMVYYLTKL